MAGEGKLGLGREDPQADVGVAVRRVDEDRLRERHLAREALKVVLGDPPRVREHRELVAGQWPVREDVTDDVAKDRHLGHDSTGVDRAASARLFAVGERLPADGDAAAERPAFEPQHGRVRIVRIRPGDVVAARDGA